MRKPPAIGRDTQLLIAFVVLVLAGCGVWLWLQAPAPVATAPTEVPAVVAQACRDRTVQEFGQVNTWGYGETGKAFQSPESTDWYWSNQVGSGAAAADVNCQVNGSEIVQFKLDRAN